MRNLVIFACLFLACVHAKLGGGLVERAMDTLGDRIDVTFGTFSGLPLTEDDATSDGWTMVNSECDTYGKQYRLSDDYALTMMFDSAGDVAGVQVAVKSVEDTTWAMWDSIYEISDDGLYVISMFFSDPDAVCSASSKRVEDDFGDRLWLRQSDGSYLDLPLNDEDLDVGAPDWVLSKCFVGMGTHYWKNITNDMDCAYFYPVAVMYTRGTLRTFLFNIGNFDNVQETSSRWEHPPQSSLSYFFYSDSSPTCLVDSDSTALSTMHFFIQNPIWNNCIG